MPVSERFFNNAGPMAPERHYCIPPLERFDLNAVLRLIRDQRYFVLHAPRQTGKTSALLALRDYLNERGEYRCVYANVETAQTARGDVARGMRAILGELRIRARTTFPDSGLENLADGVHRETGPDGVLRELLSRWSAAATQPLVLFIDEIDSLVGDTLISVLRQFRAGYDQRPAFFPQSVILCGVRDVRDYRIRSDTTKEIVAGGSAFNIKAESLRLGDFDEADVRALLGQHTEATGQAFTKEALAAVWRQTQGQPWLVNALAHQACFRDKAGRDRGRTIDEDAILKAQEDLILSRQTHLDQLADKLGEARVRRVIEPLLSGGDKREFTGRDLEYVRDLGLIAHRGPLRVANPLYGEVIPRELTYAAQEGLAQETDWYVRADGSLDIEGLLAAFQVFFREQSESWIERFEYREAGPQLVLQAFLQRIVNGGGRIEREYALGRRRTDLLIVWPPQRHVIECKVAHGGLEATIREGVRQTLDYMDRCNGESGHLVVFDRDETRPWEEKIFRREELLDGRAVTVWGA